MKKLMVLLACLPAVLAASAQNDDEVFVSSDEDKFSVSIAGFQIGFGNDSGTEADTVVCIHQSSEFRVYRPRRRSQVNFELLGGFSHGWSHLVQSDYYGAWADKGDFMDLDDAFSFAMDFCKVSVTLNQSRSLSLEFGARWTYTNFYLLDRVWFDSDRNHNPVPNFYDESEGSLPVLRSSYVGFPIALKYRYRGFFMSGSVSAEWLTREYARHKGSRSKYHLNAFNDFRSAAEITVGYDWIAAYVAYGLTPMLKSGAGNDAHTLTIGFKFLVN